MLVNPVQQSPLAYDPARQILSPPAPVDAQPQQVPATAPVQQGDTPQDKFQPRSGRGGNQQDGGTSDQEKAANAEALHNAWVRLQQLQQEANQALLAGDARGAKDAAQEAAQVAVSIQNITGSTPDVSLGAIETAAQQISARQSVQGSGGGQSQSGQGQGSSGQGSQGQSGLPAAPSGPQPGQSSLPPLPSLPSIPDSSSSGSGGSVIDIARASLGTASDVVDTAAAVPSQPAGDLASIQGYKQTVLKAIAGVEAIAARVLGGVTVVSTGTSGRFDIRA